MGTAMAQEHASDEAAGAEAPAQEGAAWSESESIGLPNRGRLRNAAELGDSAALTVKRGSEDSRWGTAEMVHMIERAAAEVARRYPGSVLNVGDISRRRGGRTRPHRSHRAGRDVDIGFYLTDEEGAPVLARQFVTIAPNGTGRDRRREHYRFDTPRNWALLEALLSDPGVQVQFVLVTRHIRERLLDHARSIEVPEDLLARFRTVSAGRQGSASHRSHFHVRVYCASDDRPRCVDAPPYHPWAFGDGEDTRSLTRQWVDADGPAQRDRARRRARRRQRARAQARARARRQRRARARMRAAAAP